jgi:hypothetical protein
VYILEHNMSLHKIQRHRTAYWSDCQ